MNEKLDRRLIRKMILQEALVLKEERERLKKEYVVALYFAEKEQQMLREGYSQEEINEGIIGDALGGIAGLFGDTFKGAFKGFFENIEQYIIIAILKRMFSGYDPDSFMGAVVANVIENIDITEIMKYFRAGNCDPIVEVLTKGIIEAMSEQGLNTLFGDRSGSGFLTGAFRESFSNAIASTQFSDSVRQSIAGVVCGASFTQIMQRIRGKLSGLNIDPSSITSRLTPTTA